MAPKSTFSGSTPSKVRNHNERLLLSLIKSEGEIAGSGLARKTGLSAQTASVITRALEAEGLISKGPPQKGKVGKPISPVRLNPDGAYAFGLRIGRRGADLVLMDFVGKVRGSLSVEYSCPLPGTIDAFTKEGIATLEGHLAPEGRARIVGIGVAAPFQLWRWLDVVQDTPDEMVAWRDYQFETAFAAFTDLPVLVSNDATMACGGELLFGSAETGGSFAYFYVGSFIGGGLVLNRRLFAGQSGNAGAFGTIPVRQSGAGPQQLINHASIYVLEERIAETLGRKLSLWSNEAAWAEFPDLVSDWIGDTASAIATAAVSVTAVLDVPVIVIDGGFPENIRQRIISKVRQDIDAIDTRGIHPPKIVAGSLGRRAGAIGVAYQPILDQYLLEGS